MSNVKNKLTFFTIKILFSYTCHEQCIIRGLFTIVIGKILEKDFEQK